MIGWLPDEELPDRRVGNSMFACVVCQTPFLRIARVNNRAITCSKKCCRDNRLQKARIAKKSPARQEKIRLYRERWRQTHPDYKPAPRPPRSQVSMSRDKYEGLLAELERLRGRVAELEARTWNP